MKPLADRTAVVAGATRGAGRGIAAMLGEAGATVYCTGRSVAGRPPASGHYQGRPETIEQTAEQVTARGGRGISIRVDHAVESEVRNLAARVGSETGSLDILVLDFWGDEAPVPFGRPFWQIPLTTGRATIERTLWPHILTLQAMVPLMRQTPAKRRPGRPVIVEVTDGPALYYRGSLFYDLAATVRARLAYAIAEELAADGITALAVTPGYLRTELALDAHGVAESNWRDAANRDPGWLASESPNLIGRGVAALAADPQSARFAGGLYGSWVLAREYGVTEDDGSRPDFGQQFKHVYDESPAPHRTGARWRISHETETAYDTQSRSQANEARRQ